MLMRFSESIDSKDGLDEDSQELDQDQSDNLEEDNSKEVSSEEAYDRENEFGEESDCAEMEPEESNDIQFNSKEGLQHYGSKSIQPEISDHETSSSYQPPEHGGDGQETGNYTSEDESRISKEAEEVSDSDLKSGWLGGREASHIAAAAMVVVLIASLVMTFYTEIVPEFVGALVSSILIVTLIIYGAATLLKA